MERAFIQLPASGFQPPASSHRRRACDGGAILRLMSGLTARLEGFAREHLRLGRGEWWIVNEIVRRNSEVDETEARAIVARVAPRVVRQFVRRRRFFLGIGILVLGGSLASLVFSLHDRHGPIFALIGTVVGSFLVAHGWPGLRRLRSGDPPTSVPGSAEPGPVSTGLGWRADPFDRT